MNRSSDTARLFTDLAWLWPIWGEATEEYADYCAHVTEQIRTCATGRR